MMLEPYENQSMSRYLTAPERLSLVDLQKQVHAWLHAKSKRGSCI